MGGQHLQVLPNLPGIPVSVTKYLGFNFAVVHVLLVQNCSQCSSAECTLSTGDFSVELTGHVLYLQQSNLRTLSAMLW